MEFDYVNLLLILVMFLLTSLAVCTLYSDHVMWNNIRKKLDRIEAQLDKLYPEEEPSLDTGNSVESDL
jgi:hypothetical protein